MPYRNMMLLLLTGALSYTCYVRAEQNPYSRYAASGFSLINRWALAEVPDQELFEGAMNSMVAVLSQHGDEHSLFVDEREREGFRENILQEFGGIGVRIRLFGDPPHPFVIGPPEPGTPAFHTDIRSGDQILAIDGHLTSGMTMLDVLHLMRGKPGTWITLKLLHAKPVEESSMSKEAKPIAEEQSLKGHSLTTSELPIEVRLQRATITVDSILGDLRDKDGHWDYRLVTNRRIGYVRITQFGDKTVDELTHVLAALTKAIVEPSSPNSIRIGALILDMRDNYGGALDAAVAISDLFLPGLQTILTTQGRDQETRDRYASTDQGLFLDLPLVVLINHNSASASEIVTACLQDYGRAVVMGQRSYGKGTVQRLMRLESGRSLLKLTSATYWRPSGKNIHRMADDTLDDQWGVKPNPEFELKLDEKQYLSWRMGRQRRDLIDHDAYGDLTAQADKENGKLPEALNDQVLDLAVEYLEGVLGE
jgi:carboxyl-terminal processing protease